MEMRACAETGISRDLTPPIPPLAASLYDSYLRSHCSSCFLPIPPSLGPDDGSYSTEASPAPCSCCNGALRYCSARCRDADLDAHASSGECHLLRLVQLHHSQLSHWWRDDTTDLRAAIRLLHSFEKHGLFPLPRCESRRIGGLMAGNPEEVRQGCELAERIREGGPLICRARKLIPGGVEDGCGGSDDDGDGEAEEAVLWAVVTNAVEVQVGEGGAIGIAVYGPRFSWFNHSCSPNACYRFELLGSECSRSDEPDFLVYPAARAPEDDMVTSWAFDERKQNQGLCRHGPRIVVRSIRPIRQGEEVCITYTDLLQPTASRRSDLWSKYGFICCCKRCSANPEVYVDRMLCETVLSLDTANLNSCHKHQKDEETEEPADIISQVAMEYLSIGGPEACCSYVENMLSMVFKGEWLQPLESSPTLFKLQPLHHIALKAYIMLASMYRVRGCDLVTSNNGRRVPEVFDMSRAAAAYSLLLAGTTNHFFLSEPSLITTSTLFWISSGESVLVLVRNLMHGQEGKWVNLSDFTNIFCDAQIIMTHTAGSSLSWDEFNATSSRFLDCILGISSKVWPFMTFGIQCLSDVKSPIDFSWLEKKYVPHQVPVGESVVAGVCHSINREGKCIGCKCEAKVHAEEVSRNLYRLAIHCLVYGGFLATICYGYPSYWVKHVRMLLASI